MLETVTVDRAVTADGTEFVLARHGEEWVVRAGGRTLMSSRVHDSEEELAEAALERAPQARSILVGGLGLGFTLRAVLDRAGPDARVTVAELVPNLVEWNRTHVAPLADYPLRDPRCEVVVGDVYELLKQSVRAFDVILLDVDNGPVALSSSGNDRLYSERGVRVCRSALRGLDGVLAVWSAGPSPRFERRLAHAGMQVEVLRVAARSGSRARHVIFLAQAR